MKGNREYDYSDRFSAIVRVTKPISAKKLSEQFFYAPKWIRGLMNLRNAIMKPFGLKDSRNLSDLVSVISYNIAIISKNAKHLDSVIEFYTAKIDIENHEISVSTIVHFNNRMGRCYFTVIRPFHNVICKTLLKRAKTTFGKYDH